MTNGRFYNIFSWIAGVDRSLLNECSDYEKNRQASTGLLILMPVTLGFISMSFAIYTISKHLFISSLFGLIWAGFILIIDRYLISTYVKTDYERIDLRLITNLFIRFIFALGVGITVSHPLVLFILDETIQKYIVKSDIAESEDIDKKNRQLTKGDSLLLVQLRRDRQAAKESEECIEIALDRESTSTERVRTSCPDGTVYESSGRPNPPNQIGPNTIRLNGYLQREVANGVRIQNEIDRITKELQRKDTLVGKKQEEIEKAASNDYLTRAVTLSKLEADPQLGYTVSTIKNFLLVFFIFIDLIPLIFKMLLKYGEYDQKVSETEILYRYLSKYKYGVNRELVRLSIEQIFRLFRHEIQKAANMTFNTIEELIGYLKKFKL